MDTRSVIPWTAAVAALVLVAGCGIGDSTLDELDPGAVPAVVTYRQHVQPRLDYYCVSCHNPDGPLGSAGGWDLSTYLFVRAAHASIMDAAVSRRSMPPGGARRLTPTDEAVLRKWKAGGFQQGQP